MYPKLQEKEWLYNSIPPEQSGILLDTGIISTAGDIEEDTDSEEEREEGWSSVTDEWECYTGQREDIEIDAHIDKGLGEDESCDTRGHVFAEEVIGHLRDEESTPPDIEVESDEEEYSDEPELFGNYREDEISFDLRKVSEFLYRLPKSETEKSPTPDSDKSLFGLEVDGFILDRRLIISEEVIDSISDIWEWSPIWIIFMFPEAINRNRKNKEYQSRCHKVLHIPPSYKEHNDHDGGEDENRTKVRLEDEKEDHENKVRHIWDEAIFKITHLRLTTLEEVGEIDNESEFHKLNRLEWEWEKWDIDPSFCPIVRHSDEEHEHEREEAGDKNLLGIFFENRIRSLDYNGKEDESENDVRDILEQVKIVVRIRKGSLGNHKRGDFKRRVHTHRTDHNHPEYDERENDEENGIIDIFGFHRTDEKLQVFSKNYLDI